MNWYDFQRHLQNCNMLMMLGLLYLFLLLFLQGCSSSSARVEAPLILLQEQQIVCNVDTNGDLMECMVRCISALDSCNADKAAVKNT